MRVRILLLPRRERRLSTRTCSFSSRLYGLWIRLERTRNRRVLRDQSVDSPAAATHSRTERIFFIGCKPRSQDASAQNTRSDDSLARVRLNFLSFRDALQETRWTSADSSQN